MRKWVWAAAIPLSGALVAEACSSSKEETPNQGISCLLKSDCPSPLVCVLGICHQECADSTDCPSMQHCRQLTARGYNGCVADQEFKCVYNSDCRDLLKCSVDGQCRSECVTSVDCLKGQTCDVLRDIGVCADQSELSMATGHLIDKSVGGDSPVIAEAGGTGGAGGGTGGAGGGAGAGGNAGEVVDSSMLTSDASTDARDAAPARDAIAESASDAGSLAFVPSLIDPNVVDFTNAPAQVNSLGNAKIQGVAMKDASSTLADLWVFKSLIVNQSQLLMITGTRPAIIVVRDTVDIQGKIVVQAGQYTTSGNPGPGVGQGGMGFGSGGGGGTYCGIGGLAAGPAPIAMGGMPAYGDPTLVPLLGGSAGGFTQDSSGNGGGALAIIAGQSITIRQFASINAGGYPGTANPVGGGSGGSILLEAPVVSIIGNVAANGGGGSGMGGGAPATADNLPAPGGGTLQDAGAASSMGGNGSAGMSINGSDAQSFATGNRAGGGGGAGRIRINTATGAADIGPMAIVSPSLATPCATQGTLSP